MQAGAIEEKPSAVARLMSWADRWFQHGPGRGELDALSPQEFARVAHDLGLSITDLDALSHHPEEERLPLFERLQLLGLDVEELRRNEFLRDLERTCAMCSSKQKCRHDMEDHPLADDWKSYCGNRSVLEQMVVEPKACCCGASDCKG